MWITTQCMLINLVFVMCFNTGIQIYSIEWIRGLMSTAGGVLEISESVCTGHTSSISDPKPRGPWPPWQCQGEQSSLKSHWECLDLSVSGRLNTWDPGTRKTWHIHDIYAVAYLGRICTTVIPSSSRQNCSLPTFYLGISSLLRRFLLYGRASYSLSNVILFCEYVGIHCKSITYVYM